MPDLISVGKRFLEKLKGQATFDFNEDEQQRLKAIGERLGKSALGVLGGKTEDLRFFEASISQWEAYAAGVFELKRLNIRSAAIEFLGEITDVAKSILLK